MKRTLCHLALVAAAIVAPSLASAQHAYISAAKCKPCHNSAAKGEQYNKWEKSKHAGAFNTLTTPKAAEIAKAKGIAGAASEAKECLECHAINDAAADPKMGVQCESCHGAGADYKAMAVMKVRADAAGKGMAVYADKAAVEAMCKKCHNEKSPTAKPFNFDERMAAIAHKKPAA